MRTVSSDIGSLEWDCELARLGGHPWQSALWGDARQEVDGVVNYRWAVREGRDVVQMIRVEERRIPGLGKVAWVPRGPVDTTAGGNVTLEPEIRQALSERGFVLAVINPWRKRTDLDESEAATLRCPRTIWIDLTVGRDRLWRNLSQGWRRGVCLAEREGVAVVPVEDPERIDQYIELCRRISQMKQFELRMSAALIERLISRQTCPETEARLFVALCDDAVAAGALAFRCGPSVHYFGGASDRAFTRQHPGEAVHWQIIEWALSAGCSLYDLEGIDPDGNPGTYSFKKKMGGDEVTLLDRQVHPIGLKGRILAPLATQALGSSLVNLPSLARAVWSKGGWRPYSSELAK